LIEDRRAIAEFCRAIETYLCRKNDGHLIRVTGPSFDLVASWATRGVPLKIAYKGIDRCFERYYRAGPRRRPVKIDFCEADVLDVFDEWRRALGLTGGARAVQASDPDYGSAEHDRSAESLDRSAESLALHAKPRISLPQHLERVVMRLSEARARGTLGDEFDDLIDRASRELDDARKAAGGMRGAARRALVDRLAALDAELLARARELVTSADRAALEAEAEQELSPYRASMDAEMFARTREAAINRLVRERANLPTISYLHG
jgi:hypothetical protein